MVTGTRDQGDVTVEADGRVVTLRLDLNAICLCEEHYSTPEKDVGFFAELLPRIQRNMRVLRFVIWAASRRHHPDLTLEEVGQLMPFIGASTIKALIDTVAPDARDLEALAPEGANGRPSPAPPKKARRGPTGGVYTSMHAGSGSTSTPSGG